MIAQPTRIAVRAVFAIRRKGNVPRVSAVRRGMPMRQVLINVRARQRPVAAVMIAIRQLNCVAPPELCTAPPAENAATLPNFAVRRTTTAADLHAIKRPGFAASAARFFVRPPGLALRPALAVASKTPIVPQVKFVIRRAANAAPAARFFARRRGFARLRKNVNVRPTVIARSPGNVIPPRTNAVLSGRYFAARAQNAKPQTSAGAEPMTIVAGTRVTRKPMFVVRAGFFLRLPGLVCCKPT